MEFFRPGIYIDFMRLRRTNLLISLILFGASIAAVFYPGPNYGIDFAGGTEVQVQFAGAITAGELRSTLASLGYNGPDVVTVEGRKNEYIIRVQEVSSISAAKAAAIRKGTQANLPVKIEEMKVSPGGDKISLRLAANAEPEAIDAALTKGGARVRTVAPFGQQGDHRYEAQLIGVADQMLKSLSTQLKGREPGVPRRVEWVGPRAGAQLRDAALKSLLYAIAFIMVYVTFRFDLRFAPGGVIAMVHDAVITVGIFVALRKEVNLTLVAAILTIVGYSINDTIVVYDRVRENMARRREMSMGEIVNLSTSETLSRTIITGGSTLLTLGAFFVWGTPVIRDFSLALIIGILVGTYSSIYVAAPVTEWIDRSFFRRA